mgnify:CR=1 FL=1
MPALESEFLQRPLAHRALHDRTEGRIENSLLAIEAACQHGYGIEIDVQLSQDNTAMVFHDDQLDRLTPAAGLVAAWTSDQLTSTPLTDSTDTIPTLDAVLSCVAGRVPLVIELKDQHATARNTALAQAVANTLAAYQGPVALMSFSPVIMHALAPICPNLPRGLVSYDYAADAACTLPKALQDHLTQMRDYDAVGASFISYRWQDLPHPAVAQIKAKGGAILCWTTKSPADDTIARQIADNVTFEGYLP